MKGKWLYDDALLEGNDGRIDCRRNTCAFRNAEKEQGLQLCEA